MMTKWILDFSSKAPETLYKYRPLFFCYAPPPFALTTEVREDNEMVFGISVQQRSKTL